MKRTIFSCWYRVRSRHILISLTCLPAPRYLACSVSPLPGRSSALRSLSLSQQPGLERVVIKPRRRPQDSFCEHTDWIRLCQQTSCSRATSQGLLLNRTRRSFPIAVVVVAVNSTHCTYPYSHGQGCRGDGISIPIPIPYPQESPWESPYPRNPK